MCVIVAIYNDTMPESEFPVLSVGSDVDAGYVLEVVTYYFPYGEELGGRYEYPGKPENPEDFQIGGRHFFKKDGTWYYNQGTKNEPQLNPIVYGQKALESYGSGEMFKGPMSRFSGD